MYLLRLVCFRGIYITRILPVYMHSDALQEQKSCKIRTKTKFKMSMLFPNSHLLSNGALDLGSSLISCAEKCIKLFIEAVLAFNLHFPPYSTLTYKNTIRKSVKFWSQNNIQILDWVNIISSNFKLIFSNILLKYGKC